MLNNAEQGRSQKSSTVMTMTKPILTFLALLSAAGTASAAGAVDLTKENFHEQLKCKNAFVKFFAMWYLDVVMEVSWWFGMVQH
jgi:hypothetical protein